MAEKQFPGTSNEYSYTQKVWIAGGILSFIVIILLLLKATFNVLLLVLAGTLIAVFFRGLGDLIQRKTGWKEGICVTISVVGTLLILVVVLWLMGAKIQSQVTQLQETLPATIENAKQKLNESQLGKSVVEKLSSPKAKKQAENLAETFFKSTFGALGDVYVILFIGIFFTVSPSVYKKGIIKLIPPGGKEQGKEVVNKLSTNMAKWLKGKIFAMFVVFVLTSIGLLILGIPMWLVLAIIAGLLNFIPNFGPLLAMIPAVLVALLLGPATALWVAGLYTFIQFAESNFITPFVQQKLISIPPALIIIAQLLMAPLTGGWGLVLATPLMLIIIVLVQELYIKKQETNG